MSLEIISTYHLVKSEDLNHHGTVFAGRCAEWFVEAGFVCVARILPAHHVVCLNIHGMEFLHSAHLGDTLQLNSRIVYTGKSSVMVYICVTEEKSRRLATDGFITFCYVDQNTRPKPHGLTVRPETQEEQELYQQALDLVAEQKKKIMHQNVPPYIKRI